MKQETIDKALKSQHNIDGLYADIRSILSVARQRAYSAVNFTMVESYWLIGQTSVEHEQHGETRAYGMRNSCLLTKNREWNDYR